MTYKDGGKLYPICDNWLCTVKNEEKKQMCKSCYRNPDNRISCKRQVIRNVKPKLKNRLWVCSEYQNIH